MLKLTHSNENKAISSPPFNSFIYNRLTKLLKLKKQNGTMFLFTSPASYSGSLTPFILQLAQLITLTALIETSLAQFLLQYLPFPTAKLSLWSNFFSGSVSLSITTPNHLIFGSQPKLHEFSHKHLLPKLHAICQNLHSRSFLYLGLFKTQPLRNQQKNVSILRPFNVIICTKQTTPLSHVSLFFFNLCIFFSKFYEEKVMLTKSTTHP